MSKLASFQKWKATADIRYERRWVDHLVSRVETGFCCLELMISFLEHLEV